MAQRRLRAAAMAGTLIAPSPRTIAPILAICVGQPGASLPTLALSGMEGARIKCRKMPQTRRIMANNSVRRSGSGVRSGQTVVSGHGRQLPSLLSHFFHVGW
jgi:hypothetical protein